MTFSALFLSWWCWQGTPGCVPGPSRLLAAAPQGTSFCQQLATRSCSLLSNPGLAILIHIRSFWDGQQTLGTMKNYPSRPKIGCATGSDVEFGLQREGHPISLLIALASAKPWVRLVFALTPCDRTVLLGGHSSWWPSPARRVLQHPALGSGRWERSTRCSWEPRGCKPKLVMLAVSSKLAGGIGH